MTRGIVLRLTQTGLSKIPLPLTDLDAFSSRDPQDPSRPADVPTTGFVDLPYTQDIAQSFAQGAISKYITRGYLTYEFIVEEPLALAILDAAGGAEVTYDPITDPFLLAVR